MEIVTETITYTWKKFEPGELVIKNKLYYSTLDPEAVYKVLECTPPPRPFLPSTVKLQGVDHTVSAHLIEPATPQYLWDTLGDVPIDDCGHIKEQFLHFKPGTNRYEIWRWFEDELGVSVHDLMYPGISA